MNGVFFIERVNRRFYSLSEIRRYCNGLSLCELAELFYVPRYVYTVTDDYLLAGCSTDDLCWLKDSVANKVVARISYIPESDDLIIDELWP